MQVGAQNAMTAAAVPISYRFQQFGPLTSAERGVLDRLAEPAFHVRRRETIRMEGDPVAGVFVLESGWVASSTARQDGGRLLLRVHLPGDILGGSSLACARAAETLTALTSATVSRVSLAALGDLFARQPRLAALLFLNAQQERVALGDRIASIGRSSADSSVAGFLLGIYQRLRAADPDLPPRFDLPLTLDDIGDALGLTPVHVSRTLTKLSAAGLTARRGRKLELLDLDRLERMAGMPVRGIVRDLDWLPPPRD